MNISPISQSAITGTQLAPPSALPVTTGVKNVDNAETESHGRHQESRDSALSALRQEQRLKLTAEFNFKFSYQQKNYAQVQGPPTVADAVAESLQAARQMVEEAPTTSASSLIKLRASIMESASFVRNIIGDQGNFDDVDSAVAKADAEIAKKQNEVSHNRVSNASVLEVESETKQRTSIRIRTQEGDVVRLSIKRSDQFSATDKTSSENGNTVSSTEVSVSTRSRMVLKIEGDINEAEYAAIQNVFSQAEEIANSFFGGDLQAAFDSAQGFEFDMGQLARVNMRFRLQQDSSIFLRESIRVADKPGDDATLPVIDPIADADTVVAEPASVVAESDAAASQTPSTQATSNAFSDSISRFLRSVGDGFAAGVESQSVRLHFSESFKLEILKAVVGTTAPDSSVELADKLIEAIDGLLDVKID